MEAKLITNQKFECDAKEAETHRSLSARVCEGQGTTHVAGDLVRHTRG